MIDYTAFYIVSDDGYPQIKWFYNEDDEEGKFVCLLDAGDSIFDVLTKIDKFIIEISNEPPN